MSFSPPSYSAPPPPPPHFPSPPTPFRLTPPPLCPAFVSVYPSHTSQQLNKFNLPPPPPPTHFFVFLFLSLLFCFVLFCLFFCFCFGGGGGLGGGCLFGFCCCCCRVCFLSHPHFSFQPKGEEEAGHEARGRRKSGSWVDVKKRCGMIMGWRSMWRRPTLISLLANRKQEMGSGADRAGSSGGGETHGRRGRGKREGGREGEREREGGGGKRAATDMTAPSFFLLLRCCSEMCTSLRVAACSLREDGRSREGCFA